MDNVHSFSTFFLGWDLENLVFGPSKRENLRCDLENVVFEPEKCETPHIVSQKQQVAASSQTPPTVSKPAIRVCRSVVSITHLRPKFETIPSYIRWECLEKVFDDNFVQTEQGKWW